MAGNNMGVEKQVEELKKRVEELERESKEFEELVAKREGIDVRAEKLRREWIGEANRMYFAKKRVVKNVGDKLADDIALGKAVQLDKIIRKVEEKVGADIAKSLYDVTDEKEMLQKLRGIEITIAKMYREDKELQKKLDLARKGRKLSLYYRGKVIERLKKRGRWKEMTVEELEAEIEAHKNVLEEGA